MPLDTETIDITGSPILEAGSRFFARMAYPTAEGATQRNNFFSAMTRWAILALCHADEDWAADIQGIRPGHFMPSDTMQERTLREGIKQLNQRFCVAHFIAMPVIMDMRRKTAEFLGGVSPSVSNTIPFALEALGWEGDSDKTFANKYLKPTRPVVHAACAFLLFRHHEDPKSLGLNSVVQGMIDGPLLRKIVLTSEMFRSDLIQSKRFKKLTEMDTVQFLVT